MANLPASGYISDAARTTGQAKQAFEDQRDFIEQDIGGSVEESLTISGGNVTPTKAILTIDTEGAAASDDLDHIVQTNLPDGRLLLVRTLSDSHDVVVRHAQGGSGQINLADGANLTLLTTKMWLLLRRESTTWEEVGRFYGDQKAAFATWAAVVKTAGDTMTGQLVLVGDPSGSNDAARKAYVDSGLAAKAPTSHTHAAADVNSGVLGTARLGTGTASATTRLAGDGTWKRDLGLDPEAYVQLYDDFLAGDLGGAAGAGTILRAASPWLVSGSSFLASTLGDWAGALVLGGDNTNIGTVMQADGAGTHVRAFLVSKNPELRVRFNQSSAGAGTRRIGLMHTPTGAGDPASGMFLRHTASGAISAVCRTGGSESVLATGITADTTMHTYRLVMNSGTGVELWVDGVLIGTITTNVPASNDTLGFYGSVGANGATNVSYLDYVWVRAGR